MKKHLAFVLSLLLLAPVLFAQFETSEVLGSVKDPSGAAVAKATVTLTNQGTGIGVKATTDDNGEYDFLNVKVGQYNLTVEQPGFSKFITNVRVDVEARQRVDATLQLGAVSESVVVSAAALVQTDSSELSQVMGTQAVGELPLNGRNYADLALLSANTVKSPIAVSFGPTGTPREGSFNVNGMRSTYNNFLLDGLDNNAYGTSNQGYSSQLVQPSPDSLAEFKVITSNYSAIHEDVRLQFRSEFFNFLNHTNFGIPDVKTTDAAFGTIRSTYPARQVQFALKLLF